MLNKLKIAVDSINHLRMKLFLVFVFLCLVTETSFSKDKDTITIGTLYDYEPLNPLIGSQSTPLYMMLLVYRPLITLSNKMERIPYLIEELPTLKNKSVKVIGSQLEVKIKLLPNLNWGDGHPVTCKDIIFAVKMGKNNNVSVPVRGKFDNIERVEEDAKNSKTCTVHFKNKRYDFLDNMPDPMPEHLEAEIFNKYSGEPGAYEKHSLYSTQPTHPGLYLGPYLLTEVKIGSHTRFTANRFFFGKAAAIKNIVVKKLSDTASLEAHMSSKSIDMIASWGGLGIDQAIDRDKRLKEKDSSESVIFGEGLAFVHLDFNLDHPILSDLKVRKALFYGVNRKHIIEFLIGGRARLAHHFIYESDPWYTQEVTHYEYDPGLSNRLLEDAGWKRGKDGVREKNGKRLSFELKALAGSKMMEMIETYVQDQWKNIGVEIRIRNESSRNYFADVLPSRNFDLAILPWLGTPESSPRPFLSSGEVPSVKNSKNGMNYAGYKSKIMDGLIDALEIELDSVKRAKIAKKILQRYTLDVPAIPLYFKDSNAVIPKDLKNFKISGGIYPETIYAEEWTY